MPLDSLPPFGTRVTVYGRPGIAAAGHPLHSQPPAGLRPAVWIWLDEPLDLRRLLIDEFGVPPGLVSQHQPVFHGLWVSLADPILRLLPEELAP